MNQRVIADPSQHGWVEVDGKWVWDAESGGGAGAGMVISETEPTDKVEGMQWLNPTTGLVLFWDDEKWLQMPTTGAAGKDGVDGVDGLWTDNGDTSISYMDGNVGIGTTPGSTTGLSLNRDYNLSWQEGSGTSICNAFRQTQTGSFVLAQGYKWSPTGGGFASSQGGQFGRSAVRLGGKIQFYVDSPVNVPEGADFTPTSRMIIDADGNVGVGKDDPKGKLEVDGLIVAKRLSGSDRPTNNAIGGFGFNRNGTAMQGMYLNATDDLFIHNSLSTGKVIFSRASGEETMKLLANGRIGMGVENPSVKLDVNGTIKATNVTRNGIPVIDAKGLINTLSTLRNATKDETTLEGLRDSIGNAIGGLIEEFENQIATMPMPEASTQEIADE